MMMAQGGVSLPAGYTKIEYLESDGTQFIDTGYKPNNNTRVVADFQYTDSSDWQTLFGVENGSAAEDANKDAFIFIMANYQGNYFHYYYGEATPSVGVNLDPTARFQVDLNKNVMTIGGQSYVATERTFQLNYTLTLFAYNQGGTHTLKSKARIYSCEIYDNGVKVRDFIPCTNPDGISGLWDSVNDVFYKMLPADYTRLDFIESDGTTYIDTGFKPNNNTRVVFKGYSNSSLSGWIFGSWASATSNQFAASCLATYSIRYGTKNAQPAAVTVGDVNIDMNKNKYTYNGASGSFDTQTFSSSYPIYLFAINDAGRVSSGKFYGKLYSCQIYDNGTLVRDFIPAMNASGEAGLYDLKNDVWYALLPVAKPKVENKISIVTRGYTEYTRYGIQLQYPAASELIVACNAMLHSGGKAFACQHTVYITKGESEKWSTYVEITGKLPNLTFEGTSLNSIKSISPTEDDTYIYTF